MKVFTARISFQHALKALLVPIVVFACGLSNLNAQVSTYTFAASAGTYTPITGGTVHSSGTGMDDATFSVTLPFTFNFDGQAFTQVWVAENGFIAFGATNPGTTNRLIISSSYAGRAFAAYSADLGGFNSTSEMRSETIGTAPNRQFVAQWTNVSLFSATPGTQPQLFTFQVILDEAGGVAANQTLKTVYSSMTTSGTSAGCQVGLRGSTNAAFNNRKNSVSLNWTSPEAGTANSDVMTVSTTVFPASGQTYTWTPPAPCTTPGNQPTSFSATGFNASTINGSFTAATSNPNGYLVVRYPSGGTPTSPVNGTTYATNGTLGTGTIVQSGAATTFSATGLAASTTYDFYVYSMNNLCAGGPIYLATSPLSGSGTTTAPLPPTCPTTLAPLNAATGVPITQVISWSGAVGSPAITGYDLYFGTNSALVAAQNPSVRVITNANVTSYTPPTPGLSYNTVYYWKVVPINAVGPNNTCSVNSFTTYVPGNITSTTLGGLWNSPATWVGGVVPVAGDNVTIDDGAIVTIDVAVTGIGNLTVGKGTSGVLQWGSSNFAMTLFGNLFVDKDARFLPYTTGGTGQTINIGGNLIIDGYANFAVASTLVNTNGSQQAGGSLSQSIGGTGTYQGNGTTGIIRSLFHQTTGTTTLNVPIIATNGSAATAGTLATGGNLTLDNTAQVYGQAFNTQLQSIGMTNMGSGYTSAPIVFGATASPWVAAGTATINTRYFSGSNVYICSVAGTFGGTAPTHSSGLASNGTAELLWLGAVGTLGTPFQLTAVVVGTQYFYGGNLYVCTVAGTPVSTAPPVHTTGAVASGTATFLYVGTPATASVVHDAVTGTVRALAITNTGDGYSSAPSITIIANTAGTGATATGTIFQNIGGAGFHLMQKSGAATISGGTTINNTQGASSQSGVGAIFTTGGGVGYLSAPTVGFSGPTALNLVTAGGSGFTSNPTITVTGGTLVSGTALTSANFTITVNQGRVVSVYLSGGTATYSVLPTLAFSGGGGTGATLAFPSGCLPTATATVGTNGQVTNFTVTNAGFGYVVAPTVGLTGGSPITAATAPTARLGLYSLTLNFFTPALSNTPHADNVSYIPANRKLNALTVTNSTFNLSSNLEIFGSATPLTLSTTGGGSSLNLGGNNLLFTWNGYAGATGALLGSITNGSMTLTTRGGGTAGSTLNYPFDATYTTFTGTGTAASGSTITQLTVSRTGAPSGTGTPPPIGARAYNAVVNAGAVYGTNPTVTLNFNGNDALITDNASLRISQSAAVTGPWTERSVASGTGALPATGSRTTATSGVGPIVPTGNDFFAWSSGFSAPPALAYTVSRTTANAYQSIAPTLSGGDGTGTLSTAAGDEGTQLITTGVAAVGFQYQGATVDGFVIHTNGYIQLRNSFNPSPTTASSWDNTLSATNNGFTGTPDLNKRNIIAPFYDDLNKTSPVIYHKIDGTKIIVEWFNTTFFGLSGPQLFFQVVLDGADESITFNYGNMQLYNGTQNIRYSYTSGISGGFVQAIPALGQVMQQQFENTTRFTHENGGTSNWGANGLAISPEPRSSIKFTPGTYSPSAPPTPAAPVNDDVAGAILRPALPAFPSNIAWDNGTNTTNLYTTRYATNTVSPAVCGGSSTAKDVWFRFVAPNPSVTVRIYGSGGFIPRVAVYDASLNLLPGNCVVGTQGLIANTSASGLTIGSTYYVRVYHENTGTQATATATVSGGAVTGLTITPGTNYSNPATAFSGYAPQNQGPIITFSGGGGNGAAAGWVTPTTPSAVLPLTGANISFVGGTGYTSAPTVTIESPDWGITGEFGIVLFSLPENDECAGAITLTGLATPGCTLGANSRTTNTTGASASPESATCGTPDDDLWYKFDAVSTSTSITASGTGLFDAAFELYDGGTSPGACVGKTSLSCTNATGTGGTESLTATTVIGKTYYVRVYHAGAGSAAGETFTLCVSSAPPACVASPTSPTNAGNLCQSTSNTTLSWPAVAFATGYDVYLEPGASITLPPVSVNQVGTSFTTAAPLTAGPYIWRIVPKNANGDATSCTDFTFTVNAIPTVNITPVGPINICTPATQVLNLGTTSASSPTYQWQNAAVNISGQTASSFTASANGTYRLVVTDGTTTCTAASNVVTVSVGITPNLTVSPSSITTTMCNPATLTASSTSVPLAGGSLGLVITEVTLFSTGTGATSPYPSFVTGSDFVEISNASNSPIDVSGYTFHDYPTASAVTGHPFTIPPSTIIPAGGVMVIHMGTGTDDVPNRFFNTGGTTDTYFSGGLVGIVLKNGATIVDAVGINSGYVFDAGTGVTAGDWSGFASSPSGIAGTIRSSGTDTNTGADWVPSNTPSPLQTIGTANFGVVAWTPTTGLFKDLALTMPYAGENLAVVYAKPTTPTTYTVTLAAACPATATSMVTIGGCSIALESKMFLSHSSGGVMDDYLRQIPALPVDDPYADTGLPYEPSGNFVFVPSGQMATTTQTILDNNNVVDWIFVELRTGTSGATTVVASKSGLLKNDGTVINPDGTPFSFSGVAAGNYFVAIKHRNHVGFMTDGTVALPTASLLNLTDGSVTLYEPNHAALNEIAPGVFAMWTGDANVDTTIDGGDVTLARSLSGSIVDEYHQADVNLDGSVDGGDVTTIRLNSGLIGQQID